MFLAELVHRLKEKQRKRKGTISYKDIKFLKRELRSMRATLRMVGDVPPQELLDGIKIFANDLRPLVYDTEDLLDSYLVRVESLQPADRRHSSSLLTSPSNMDKARIAAATRDIKTRCVEVFDRFPRYIRVDDVISKPPIRCLDPRILALFRREEGRLIGIEEAMEELTRRMTEEVDDVSNQQLKTISLVGLPGVGKTALSRVLYEKLESQFGTSIFVSLGPNPNMKHIFTDMAMQLGLQHKRDLWYSRDHTEIIDIIKEILQNKRFLIVVDDIWDRKAWLTIKTAMVANNLGSIIIATTRKLDVAEEVGGVYRVHPLSYQSSRILFCSRIFGTNECSDNELAEISENILKKCAGVPLAIVEVSGMLAGKPSEQWHEVCGNIIMGAGSDILMGTLLLSYYDLPSHLRNCLLYLSIFPEGHVIRRDRLVWMWIAEGFVQEMQGSNLFEVGQSYFDELLNSGMIQEVDRHDADGIVKHCSVHSIVLALILYLTTDENFATILDDRRQRQDYDSGIKIRRLSLQNRTLEHATSCVPQVRSVVAFGAGIDVMFPLSSFYVLRVLDLEGCELNGKCDLKHIRDLLQLRYLGLRGTDVAELPKEIGNLRFLQILDLKGTSIKELPSTVALLRQLLCLYVEQTTKLPKGIGNLTSLKELSKISLSESANNLKEMASLVELMVLDMALQQEVDERSKNDIVEFLSVLHKMQSLRVYGCSDLDFMSKEGWVCPPALRRFVTVDGWFSVMPTWISKTEHLSELQIGVRELWREDLKSLGRLRKLRFLCLAVERMGERLAVDADAFPSLRQLRLGAETCLVFRRGAMPKVAVLEFVLDVDKASGDFNWGLSNIRWLEKVTVNLRIGNNASANKEAEEAVRHAVDSHRNHPRLEVTIVTLTSHQDEEKQIESVEDAGKRLCVTINSGEPTSSR